MATCTGKKRPQLQRLIRDAKRLWESGKATPTKHYFLEKSVSGCHCCLVGAAFYANKTRLSPVKNTTIYKFSKQPHS